MTSSIAEAQADLALAYSKGEGLPWNVSQAKNWASKAARQGEPRAQVLLGETYTRDNPFLAYVWMSAGIAKLGKSKVPDADLSIRRLLFESRLMKRFGRAQEVSSEIFNGRFDALELKEGAIPVDAPELPTLSVAPVAVPPSSAPQSETASRCAKFLVVVEGDRGSGSASIINIKGNALVVSNAHVISGNNTTKFKLLSSQEIRLFRFYNG